MNYKSYCTTLVCIIFLVVIIVVVKLGIFECFRSVLIKKQTYIMHCVPCTFELVWIKATRTKRNDRVPQIWPPPLRQHVDSAMRLSIRWTLRGFVIFVAAYYTTRIITVHKNEKGPIRRTRSTRPLRPPTKDLIVRIVPKAVPRLVEEKVVGS